MNARAPHSPAPTLTGRIVAVAQRTAIDGVTVWFAYRPVDGEATTVQTLSDGTGRFSFDLPPAPLRSATIGASLEGVEPVDLEPDDAPLEPGELVLIVDDIIPPHLRFGGPA